MPFLTRIAALSFAFFCFLPTVRAEECPFVRPFETAHAPQSGKTKQVAIIPFSGTPDVANVVTVLMKEYLSLAKGLDRAFVSNSNDDRFKSGQWPTLSGDIQHVGEGYVFSLTLENASPQPFKVEGKFLYPDRMNDALVEAVDQISKNLKASLPPKKLLPFLNTTMSGSAYQAYAQAMTVLDEANWSETVLKKAQGFLEQAIQADYNYVPAYLGLAQVLAAQSRMAGNAALKNKASSELEKAKALLPPLADLREPAIRWYLEGKAREVCADNRGNP